MAEKLSQPFSLFKLYRYKLIHIKVGVNNELAALDFPLTSAARDVGDLLYASARNIKLGSDIRYRDRRVYRLIVEKMERELIFTFICGIVNTGGGGDLY